MLWVGSVRCDELETMCYLLGDTLFIPESFGPGSEICILYTILKKRRAKEKEPQGCFTSWGGVHPKAVTIRTVMYIEKMILGVQ